MNVTLANSEKLSRAAVLVELNRILSACGVTRFLHSTQIYQKPSFIHVISLQDLRFLVDNNDLLMSAQELNCDYRSLSVVLWSMLQDGDRVTSNLLHSYGSTASEAQKTDGNTSWWTASFTPAEKKEILISLSRLFLVTTLLCSFLQSPEIQRAQDKFIIGVEDVQRTARLAETLSQLLNVMTRHKKEELAPLQENTAIFVRLETCFVTAQQLLVELPRRQETDMELVLRAVFRSETWETSGLSLRCTTAYFSNVRQLILNTMNCRPDAGGVTSALAQIVQTRLFIRPAYRHSIFCLSYLMGLHATKGYQLDPSFGLLQLMWASLEGCEAILCPTKSATTSAADVAALESISKVVRGTFLTEVRRLQAEGRRLSFHQLLAYSIFEGMPSSDLTKVEDMSIRARTTDLMEITDELESVCGQSQDYLPLLQAVCYTARKSSVGSSSSHGQLPLSSLTPLFDAMAKHIFQLNRFQLYRINTNSDLLLFQSPYTDVDLPRVQGLVMLLVRHLTGQDASFLRSNIGRRSLSDVMNVVQIVQERFQYGATTVFDACRTAQSRKRANVGQKTTAAEMMTSTLGNTIFQGIVGVTAGAIRFALWHAANASRILPPRLLVSVLDTAVKSFAAFDQFALKVVGAREKRVAAEMKNHIALLHFIPSVMNVKDVDAVLVHTLVPLSQALTEKDNQDGTSVILQEGIDVAFLEGYLRAFSAPSAAFAVSDEHFLQHWADVALPCLTGTPTVPCHTSVLLAAHDFFAAAFFSKRVLAPLLMPSYVAAMIPVSWNLRKQREPPLALLRHFATLSRFVCQSVVDCDAGRLERELEDPESAPRKFIEKNGAVALASLERISPSTAALLLVSSLFDKVCNLLGVVRGREYASRQKEGWESLSLYFSALCNLLQCTNVEVQPRVCASIEAVLLEHMVGMGSLQAQSLKFIGQVVAHTRGPLKKNVAEWYLGLANTMHKKRGKGKL